MSHTETRCVKCIKGKKPSRCTCMVEGKGALGGMCFRTGCTKVATHFNHSTEKCYCDECAKLINDANKADAMKLYGHDLCTVM